MQIIGESKQQWAPLRRKYNLFVYSPGDVFNQFAYVDEPFLSWDFALRSADGGPIGSVNRDFSGFAREIFTDTGVYALRMDSVLAAPGGDGVYPQGHTAMTLDQRAVVLATAVSIDFDYFSRSGGGGGFIPLWFPFPMGGAGGEAAAGEAAAGEAAAGEAAAGAGETGALGETASGALGKAGAGGGLAEGMASGAAGAGTMAGYDAMERGLGRTGTEQQPPPAPVVHPEEEVWHEGREEASWGKDPRDRGKGNSNDNDDDDIGGGEGGGGDGGDGGSFFDVFY